MKYYKQMDTPSFEPNIPASKCTPTRDSKPKVFQKKKLIASIHKAIELKPNKLEINFSHKKGR